MPLLLRFALICSLAFTASAYAAAPILKCVDPAGNVTFTQTVCPPGLTLDSQVSATNVPPSGGKEVVRMAEPAPPPAEPVPQSQVEQPAPTVVSSPSSSVGERPDPPVELPQQPYYDYDYNHNGGRHRPPPYNYGGNYPAPPPPRPPVVQPPPPPPAPKPSITQQARDNIARAHQKRDDQN